MGGDPLSADYTVVGEAENYPDEMVNDPAVASLPDGELLFTYHIHPRWATWAMDEEERERVKRDFTHEVHIKRSSDRGESWTDVATVEGVHSFDPFVSNDDLFGLAHIPNKNDILIMKSNDGGETWTDPVTLFEGTFWNTPTPVVVVDDTIYKAYGKGESGSDTDDGAVLIAGDLEQNLTNPDAWRISDPVYQPSPVWSVQPEPRSKTRPRWLEGNVVNVRGDLRVYLRPDIDGATSLAGICEFSDDGNKLDSSFRQFHPVPGADCKFNIRYDAQSDLFWMTANLTADAPDTLGLSETVNEMDNVEVWGDRRFLMLYYSVDALNWFEAGCIANAPSTWEAFMYPYFIIQEDDLLVAVRTCSEKAANHHDSDQVTFHRVPDFRSLAMDVHPTPLEVAQSATQTTAASDLNC